MSVSLMGMKFFAVITICLLALWACSSQPVSTMGDVPTVITGATVLIGAGLAQIPDGGVVISNGAIAAVGDAASIDVPTGAELIDATGLTLVPGFIDAHVHIALANPRDICSQGVTTVRDLAWAPNEIWPLVAESQSP